MLSGVIPRPVSVDLIPAAKESANAPKSRLIGEEPPREGRLCRDRLPPGIGLDGVDQARGAGVATVGLDMEPDGGGSAGALAIGGRGANGSHPAGPHPSPPVVGIPRSRSPERAAARCAPSGNHPGAVPRTIGSIVTHPLRGLR